MGKSLTNMVQHNTSVINTTLLQGHFVPISYFLLKLFILGLTFEAGGVTLLLPLPNSWIAWIIAAICVFISGVS